MRSAWRWYLTAGAAVLAVYLLVPDGLARDLVYLAVGASSVAAMAVGIRTHRPPHGAAWLWLTVGQLSWVVGDAVYSWYEDVARRQPFPSSADVLYLLAYVAFGGGLVAMIRRRVQRRDLGAAIDAWIVTVALGLVSWVTVAGPAAQDSSSTTLARVVGAAYPAGDIALMALLVRLVLGAGSRTGAFRLLAAATGLLVGADTAFAVLGVGHGAGYLDLLWLASYLLWGAAALHPSMRALSEPAAPRGPMSLGRRVALTTAVLVAPATLAVQLALGMGIDGWPVVIASVVLFSLVVARMQLAVRQAQASTRERDAARRGLAHLAGHDPLTDLVTRGRALEAIEAALARSRRSGELVGLLVLDLDNFRAINDEHGQTTGDRVLRELAGRVVAATDPGDVVGRLGGDEFVVLVEAPGSRDALVARGEHVLAAASAPVVVGGAEVVVGSSVGLAFAVGGAADADALLFEAAAAVGLAKSLGRGRVEIFDEVLRREYDERRSMEAAIRAAIEHDELLVHYQPVVRVDAPEEVAYYEALVRWERPGHGMVRPDEFIPVAELSDLICDLDCWVLERVAREATTHPALAGAGVAVNISGRHLAAATVADDVTRVLTDTGLDPRRLILEITETVLVDRLGTLAQLQSLRALGVKVSIDDFGTGYTSIAEMQDLRADSLKVDRSLVASTSPGAARLVELVVHAARAFGLAVVGEGVEDEVQLARLSEIGCDLAQGFLLARPAPVDQLARVVLPHARGRARNPRPRL